MSEATSSDVPFDLRAWRRARRAELLAARLALSPDAHAQASRAILAHLARRIAPLGPRILGFYWPTRGEFDARPFVEGLAAEGVIAALPLTIATEGRLEFDRWRPGDPMSPGAFDIPVPAARDPVIPDMLLVPLLGFDERGYRLGYGAGYYDRTLAAMSPPPRAIGVGFALGRLATIFPQAHDRPMDVVITEEGVFRPSGSGLRPL